MMVKQDGAYSIHKKRDKKKSCKKMKGFLKTVGGRKGILLASIVLSPKFSEY